MRNEAAGRLNNKGREKEKDLRDAPPLVGVYIVLAFLALDTTTENSDDGPSVLNELNYFASRLCVVVIVIGALRSSSKISA